MADTVVHANNANLAFRRKGAREMSTKSSMPKGAMKIPKLGAKTAAPKVGKAKRLPAHAKKAAKQGLISDKQMAKMKDYGGTW